jgi:hypothetical protein
MENPPLLKNGAEQKSEEVEGNLIGMQSVTFF